MDKWLDLFCGAGGFSCGFLDKNNQFIGVDMWDIALETYRNNIHGETIQADMMQLDLTTIGKIDGLIGSPPCQPHSTANKHATHDTTLIKRYLEIRDALKPRWWVMEEVPGAAKYGLIEKGYIHFFKACDFGLPHVRNRLFAGNYPVPKKHPYKAFMIMTPKTMGMNKPGVPRPVWDRTNALITGMIKTPIAAMRGYYHGPDDKENIIRTATGLFPTICANSGNHVGSFQTVNNAKQAGLRTSINDIITPAFCAKIMGFPDDYAFSGNKTQQYKQIGNAVCPPVARAIWNAITTTTMRLF